MAIHLGNTNSCIAGYDGVVEAEANYYQFCIPSWVAVVDDDTIISGEATMNRAAVSPGSAISGFMRFLHSRHLSFKFVILAWSNASWVRN
ncbi:hypothetical protein GUJ93_ZPchr0013g35515 [Zizania palustris]|uniref:Uncharacterized protein n=1 Tax=Zizania palustris TaxID=103762 RepID=A0A8J5WZY0_ZIZPA|nr:hypothetical protein GUJ93_ZPchr0013g35515 [Zizania palustris]